MKRNWIICLLLAATLLLSGCMSTVDQMYCLPKRSENILDLQAAMVRAMAGLDYCAPLSGENQQTVQTADLDGDGIAECLVFAKGGSEKPMKILIFVYENGEYVLRSTIEGNGTSFDQVEYVQMDGVGGMELVVGCQVSDQVLRRVSVYTFDGTQTTLLTSTVYTKFLTVDIDSDNLRELVILRPGQTDVDNGVVELYGVENGVMERANEATMSEPVGQLKRLIVGKLQDGEPAVYVACSVDESAIITDVYAMLDGVFTNVSLSNDSGTSVQTLRNYYVYATDIDSDGVVELPDLIHMTPINPEAKSAERQYLIRWYAMRLDGTEVDKQFTFHNYVGGWYFQLNRDLVSRITVVQQGSAFVFYIWDKDFTTHEKLLTIYAFSGEDRDLHANSDGRFILQRSETTIYAGQLEAASANYGLTKENVINSFHMIFQEWKTGETK